MYTQFHIENFRIFENLTIGPLTRVNLIAGPNNTGKTALLEALWIHADPVAATAASIEASMPKDLPTEVLAGWFRNHRTEHDIVLKSTGNREAENRTFTISYQDTEGEWDTHQENDVEPTQDGPRGQETASQATPAAGLTPCIFVGHPQQEPGLRAEQYLKFDETQEMGHLRDMERAVRIMEPSLQRLEILTGERENPAVYGDLGSGMVTQVARMGEGTNRMLELAMGLAAAKDGMILADGIERGIHHTAMKEVWKYISEISDRLNVQVFATTHSNECIKAAYRAFPKQHSNEISLHWLSRNANGINAAVYHKKPIDSNIECSWELR